MGKKRKRNGDRPELFIEGSGQLRLVGKSVEQQAMESKPVECFGMTFESEEARRAFFLEKLREKLKDPEFRKTEGFPVGGDDEILALSDPPYYTACPNPFLSAFVNAHATAYQPQIPYRRQAFAIDVEGGKNDPLYNAHSYHTKVPHGAIAQYIEHYTAPGDLVMDCFCGSGMTGVAAQSAPTGPRHVILCDLSTAATHIASGFNAPMPLSSRSILDSALDRMERDLGWMYRTRVKGKDAMVHFTLWSDVLLCGSCGADIVYWAAAYDRRAQELKESFKCPECEAMNSKRAATRKTARVPDRVTGDPHSAFVQVPVLINYELNGARGFKEPDQQDLALLRRIEDTRIHDFFPPNTMMNVDDPTRPWGDKWRAGTTAFRRVCELYQARTLTALSWFYRESRCLTQEGALARFVFTSAHQYTSRLCRLHFSNFISGGGGLVDKPLEGTLYMPSLSVETNVIERLRLRSRTEELEELPRGRALISTQSATSLRTIPADSIDYVFVDPPFGENLAYAELNFPWEAWLRVQTSQVTEAIVSDHQRKGLGEYQALMTRCFKEVRKVLKPGRWMTVVFHNSRNAVWVAIQEALEHSGFVVGDVRVLSKGKGSYNAVNAAGAVKHDLVISTYKPNGGLEERFKLEAGSQEGVWDFVKTHLLQLPVFVQKQDRLEVIAERQNFLLFDRMVAFHVQRGVTVPISAAEFYAGLMQRYPERDGMYFLSEQVAEYDKKRLTVHEVQQLTFAPQDEASAILWLCKELENKPQSFQDLHPKFMKEIAGWAKHEKPLELREILEQNFLCYGDGAIPDQIWTWMQKSSTLREKMKDKDRESADGALRGEVKDRWYVPDPNKAGDLEKLRERTLLKEFDEYRRSSQKKLKVFRMEAVRAGFKVAWAAKDYASILAVAKKLPEDVLQEDPKLLMWYDQALTRTGSEG